MANYPNTQEEKKKGSLLSLAMTNLPGVNAAAAQNNLANTLKNQAGFGNLSSAATVTTPASESSDGMRKYTPGRTNVPDAVDKPKASSGGATYTVNAGNQPYVGQLNALYEQIVNRKPFQYDLNGDLLYQQMADQYAQMGAQASRNAMGQAAALTGGYGNSYAQQVGNQANQQYMTALNQNIPGLYQQALNAYLAEGDRMMQQYELTAAHPGMVEAISPQTYTVQQQSAEEGNDTSAYMQMLQNMLSGGINTTSAPATNALANWYYQLMNAQK